MPGKKSRNFDRYPNEYRKTDRNCFDCLNLKVRLQVNPRGKILYSKTNYAACKENFILRSQTHSPIEVKEPQYAITGSAWSKLNAGWRHFDWNLAGVCPHFDDMRKDDDREEASISDRLHDSDGQDLPGVMPALDSPGGALGADQPGDEILPQGGGEAVALPEIQAA